MRKKKYLLILGLKRLIKYEQIQLKNKGDNY